MLKGLETDEDVTALKQYRQKLRDLPANSSPELDDNNVLTALDINEQEVTIDMDAVNTKATELQIAHDNEQETLKTNKVSAYRKMEMTDDEILAIDPTLEEYL